MAACPFAGSCVSQHAHRCLKSKTVNVKSKTVNVKTGLVFAMIKMDRKSAWTLNTHPRIDARSRESHRTNMVSGVGGVALVSCD